MPTTPKVTPTASEEHLPGLSGTHHFETSNSEHKLGGGTFKGRDVASTMGLGSPFSDISSQHHHQPHYNRRTTSPTLNPIPVVPHPISTPPDWRSEGLPSSSSPPSWPSASPVKHPKLASVGADDLNPFPHHGIGLEPLHQPVGGMLMGPDHPMFHSGYKGAHDGFVPGSVPPGARYDPIVPPISSGSGMDPDTFGGDLLRPPRGGAPKGRSRLHPGEPGNDHMKPPGWNGSGFI